MHIAKIPAACLAATMSLGLMMSSAQAGNDLEVTFDRDALKSKSGVATQMKRIEKQVKAHCNFRSGRQSIVIKRANRECVENLMAKTVSEIGDRRLSAAFQNSQFYAGSFKERG